MLDLDEESKRRVRYAFEAWWEPWEGTVTQGEKDEALRIFEAGVRWTLSQALLKVLS